MERVVSGNIISHDNLRPAYKNFDEWLYAYYTVDGYPSQAWLDFGRVIWAEAVVVGELKAKKQYDQQIAEISKANGALRVIIKNAKIGLESTKKLK